MKDYSEIEEILKDKKISKENQELVRAFLLSFSFEKRQQLMGIFLGNQQDIEFFVDLLKKRIEFQKKPTEELAAEILEMETKRVKSLMGELA